MEDSSDLDVSSTKIKKTKRISVTERRMSEKKRDVKSEKIMQNGTGSDPEHSQLNMDSDKSKPIRITKITKVKTESKTSTDEVSPSQESASSPTAGDIFCGFDNVALNKEQVKKQETLFKILNQLTASCSWTKVPPVNPTREASEEAEENEPEEAMTVDTGHESGGDTDSEQMEIDIGNEKDTPELKGKEHQVKNIKDSDVESVKSAGQRDSKKDFDEENGAVTDNDATETPSPVVKTTLKGDGTKVEYCGTCDTEVNDAEEGICCDGDCERWFHLRCSGLSQAEYDELGLDENAKWACSKCSGKPPPQLPADAKPLLKVRKDLGQFPIPSPSIKRRSLNRDGRTPKIDISNPAFLKPFDFGWKRELVYRSTNDSQNRRQGDVYYYTPKGKKLRSLREISDYLANTDLTPDNFTFWKEPLGIDDPEKEIIRDAKIKFVHKEVNSSPAVPKKSLTPKTPKIPKVTPKLTATVTPLETSGTAKASASVTPRVVFKGKAPPSTGPKFKVTPSKTSSPAGQTQKIVISKDKKKKVVSDDELEMGMLPPMWDPIPKPKEKSAGVKRLLEDTDSAAEVKRIKTDAVVPSPVMLNFMQNVNYVYSVLLNAFQYLKVQELLRASRVCHLWRELALHKSLWQTVRMKNSQVKDWEGFSATLRRVGTKHLDLRKILMPDKPEAQKIMWNDCIKALSKVNTLVKLDLCRCTSNLLEEITAVCPQLESITAGTIKSNQINLANVGNCQNLTELKLKSLGGMDVNNVEVLGNLTKLKQLSLTTVKNMDAVLEVVGKMPQLESLELGELTNVTESIVTESISQLTRLRRLRLEKGQHECPTVAILTTIARLPSLVQLELINFDVKAGFEDALGLCSNIKILLIIPTYVTQSATTNHLVIEGVSKLSKTLNHFVWGLTLELLRVTDLFIDQWEMGQKNSGQKNPNTAPQQKKSTGDSIPILKPTVKDSKKPKEGAVTQVDVLQLPKLHKVLTTLLPTTKIIILKVPFSATWRQTISNSSQ